jgi:hypothetical protein
MKLKKAIQLELPFLVVPGTNLSTKIFCEDLRNILRCQIKITR